MIERIRDEVAKGSQVYWVCPLIDETEASDQAADEQAGRASQRRAPLDLSNVTQTHQELSEALAGHGVGLLHGRLPAAPR